MFLLDTAFFLSYPCYPMVFFHNSLIQPIAIFLSQVAFLWGFKWPFHQLSELHLGGSKRYNSTACPRFDIHRVGWVLLGCTSRPGRQNGRPKRQRRSNTAKAPQRQEATFELFFLALSKDPPKKWRMNKRISLGFLITPHKVCCWQVIMQKTSSVSSFTL